LLRTFGIGIVGAIVLGGGLFAVDRMTRKADATPTPTVVAAVPTATAAAVAAASPVASGLNPIIPGTGGTPATTGGSPVAQAATQTPAPSPTATVRPGTPTPTEAQVVDAAMADIAAPWSKADWDAVIARLAPLQARYASNTAVRDKLYAAYVEKGKVLEIAENPVEARRPYGAALQLDPSRPEARGRLQAIDPVKRAIAWRNYRWQPGLQTEDEGLRTFQSGDGYVLQMKIPNSARTAWRATAVAVGSDAVVRVTARLPGPGQAGGLDLVMFEKEDSQWAHNVLRIVRVDNGDLYTAFLEAQPTDQSRVNYLVTLGPNPGFMPANGQLDLAQLEIHGTRVTASVNRTPVWSGQVPKATGVVDIGGVSYSTPNVGPVIYEYQVYEP
jgi:hypothetical protein